MKETKDYLLILMAGALAAVVIWSASTGLGSPSNSQEYGLFHTSTPHFSFWLSNNM